MVQYILPDDKEGIQILPHDNSKSDVPYFRTQKSTLCAIKTEVMHSSPKEAVEQVSKTKGWGNVIKKCWIITS